MATSRAVSSIRPPVSRRTFGFSMRVTDFRLVLAGELEGRPDDPGAGRLGHDPRRDGDLVGRDVLEALHLGVRQQGVADDLRQGEELDSGVHALRVLAEDDEVDAFLIVQGVAGIGLAGPEVLVKVELLAEADDGAEIGQPLALELGGELGGGVLLGLRGDGPEEAGVRLLEELRSSGRAGHFPRGARIPSRCRRRCSWASRPILSRTIIVASTTSLPTPSPGRMAILYLGMDGSLGQDSGPGPEASFFLVYSRRPPASRMPMTDSGSGRKRNVPSGRADLAPGEVDLDLVAFLQRGAGLFGLDDGQAEVDGVAEIDAGEGAGPRRPGRRRLCRQAAACSRELPQPKFLPATMTSPGLTLAANPGSRSSRACLAISSGVMIW